MDTMDTSVKDVFLKKIIEEFIDYENAMQRFKIHSKYNKAACIRGLYAFCNNNPQSVNAIKTFMGISYQHAYNTVNRELKKDIAVEILKKKIEKTNGD